MAVLHSERFSPGVVIIGELRAAMASLGRQLGVANWTDAQAHSLVCTALTVH